MHQPRRVERAHGARDPLEDLERSIERQRSAREPLRERLPLEAPHGDVRPSVGELACLDYLDERRVKHAREPLCLGEEARPPLGRRQDVRARHLDRELSSSGEHRVDDGAPALAQHATIDPSRRPHGEEVDPHTNLEEYLNSLVPM